MQYNFEKYWRQCFFGQYDFRDLYDFACDIRIQKFYVKLILKDSVEYSKQNGLDILDISKYKVDKKQLIFENNNMKLNSILGKMMNLMLVNLYTMYETAMVEFITCLVVNDEKKLVKMISIYKDYEEYLQFSLKEFFTIDSKQEYLMLMGRRLAKRIISGGPKKIFERLACILDKKIDNKIINNLQELHTLRNDIVHQGENFEILINELQNFYDSFEKLNEELAIYLHKLGVKINDPGNLLGIIEIN